MDKKLLEKGDFHIEFQEGNLCLVLDTKGLDLVIKLESEYFLDELAEKIPGEIDDMIIAALKGALK